MPARGAAPAFVLIHSPLVGPTTWSPLVGELERRGREAAAPSLLGIADAPAPQWRHGAEAVHAAAKRLEHPVLLVGHSAAGPLLPVIAEALTGQVAGSVFVDAFLPPARGSAPLAPPRLTQHLRALASNGVLPPWWSWFGEETMRELVPDESLRAALEEEMPRLPISYFQASVSMPQGWSEGPCAYLLLSSYLYRESAADARRRGWPVAEVAGGGHLAMVTDPVPVTEALLRLESALASEV
jgi:pimeloyl-ACP methyl ester carboxylesterase